MTPQEIFDTAFTKVYEQGKQALLNGTCAYGDKDGNRCAVGHLLDQKEFGVYAFVYGPVDTILTADRNSPGYLRPFFHQNRLLLSDIQEAHDNYNPEHDRRPFRDYFTDAMISVAESFKLSTDVIDEVTARAA